MGKRLHFTVTLSLLIFQYGHQCVQGFSLPPPSNAPIFTAVSSRTFSPGSDYKIWVSTRENDGASSTYLKCVLVNHQTSMEFSSDWFLIQDPGTIHEVRIPVPLLPALENSTAPWTLSTYSREKNTGFPRLEGITARVFLLASEKVNKIDLLLIQTDKSVYKPEDEIKIRVITLGDCPDVEESAEKDPECHRLPIGFQEVTATLKDSKNNVIGRWTKNSSMNGLISINVPLSNEPNFGRWTLLAESRDKNAVNSVTVEVKEYILPRFKVDVHIDDIIVTKRPAKFPVEVTAVYTFGKFVEGNYTLNVTAIPFSWFGTTRSTVVFGELPSTTGSSFAELDLSPEYIYSIEATVAERNTKRLIVTSKVVRVHEMEEFKIEWTNRPRKFVPGNPLVVKILVTGLQNRLISDHSSSALTLKSDGLETQHSSIPKGHATFIVNSTSGFKLSDFTLTYKNTTARFSVPQPGESLRGVTLDLFPSHTENGPQGPFIQGGTYNFTVKSNRPVLKSFQHALVAQGKIIGVQNYNLNSSTLMTEATFSLQLPLVEVSEFDLIVYLTDTEVIAATYKIQTQNFLNIQFGALVPVPKPPMPLGARLLVPSEIVSLNETSISEEEYDDIDPARRPPPRSRRSPVTIDPAAADFGPHQKFEEQLIFQEFPRSQDLIMSPGDNISLVLETCPKSTILLRGVDQSVLLLSSVDNDVTQTRVDELSNERRGKKAHLGKGRSSNEIEKLAMEKEFNFAGLVVMTNAPAITDYRLVQLMKKLREEMEEQLQINRRKEIQRHGQDHLREEFQFAIASLDILPPAKFDFSTLKTRTEFPETWLWDEIEVGQGDRGTIRTILNKTAPDTMTSWIITGYSLNKNFGLGINSIGHQRPLKVFQQFFITLHIPYSVVANEQFAVEVIVHNYLEQDVIARVTLFNLHKDFVFLDSRERSLINVTHDVGVSKNSVSAAYFAIMPIKFGNIPLDIRAECGIAGDAIRKPLRVKPNGNLKVINQVTMLDLQKPSDVSPLGAKFRNWTTTHILNLTSNFPNARSRVPGADRLKLYIVGDQMGMMIKNLDSLLQLPGGCGEQNMLKFVPNVLALDYLKATGTLTLETKTKAVNFLLKGYQNQMTHRKSDGSFAVYNRPHYKGSTWLTAYVIKSFAAAQQHVSSIDPDSIRQGIQFLLQNQLPSGEFVEKGKAWDMRMRSRSSEPGLALTAFTTLALIQVQQYSPYINVTMAVYNGLKFISTESSYNKNDPYIFYLVTCALTEGKHAQAEKFFRKMETTALTIENPMDGQFWAPVNGTSDKVKPHSIEMTGYALLTYLGRPSLGLRDRNMTQILPIVKWLLSQRNPSGGFVSTQDTVVGLSALTKFAVQRKTRPDDEMHMTVEKDLNKGSYALEVTQKNSMVLQELNLPSSAKWITIKSRGRGQALVQLTSSYYEKVVRVPRNSPPSNFVVTAKLINDPEFEQEYTLDVCVSWSFSTDNTRDILGEMTLPSGIYFNEAAIQESPPSDSDIDRFELTEGNTKITLYYRFKNRVAKTCVKLPAEQTEDIAGLQPPVIHVYDYGDDTISSFVRYTSPKRVTICQICKKTHACDRENCPA